LEWGGQVNATTRRIKMTTLSSDTCGENKRRRGDDNKGVPAYIFFADEARRRAFSQALDRRLYEVSLYPDDDIHEIIRDSNVCLKLTADVANLGSDVKKQLFETCLNLEFPFPDPEGLRNAKITVPGAPDCFMRIELPDRHVRFRIVTLATNRKAISSKRLKELELAQSQLDEEGTNSHLFGNMCNMLFRKWRATGLEPMEERDRNILEHVRNKKNQDVWIRGRYRTFIDDRRWTQHKAAREEVIYAWYDLVMCNFSFLKVIGGLSEYIDDARVESAVRNIQFETARERAKYVDKSQDSIE